MAIEGGYGEGSFSRLSGELEKTAVYFGAATGAARAFISTLNSFSEFDRQLRLTNSVADGTAQTFEQMRKAAIDFSTTTTASATQAAQAMYFLASAGYNVQQSIQAMTGVLLLAQATMSDVAKTSDTVVSVLNQYGLQASDAAKVADIFTASITRSQATMEKLTYAFRQVGPVAAYMGQSIQETTAWLSVLFQAGLRGEQAGTTLRNMLLRLVQPTQNAAQVLRALGVDTIDPLTLKFNGLQRIMENFTDKGLTAGVIKQLVGDEAAAGFKILLRAVDENKQAAEEAQRALSQGQLAGVSGDALQTLEQRAHDTESAYKRMYDAIDPNQHTAVRIAVQNMQAFGNQMTVAKNQITDFAMAVGEAFAGGLATPLKIIGDLGTAFTSWNHETQAATGSIALQSIAMVALIANFGRLRSGIEGVLRLRASSGLREIANEISGVGSAASGATRALEGAPGIRVAGLGGAGRAERILNDLVDSNQQSVRAAAILAGSAGISRAGIGVPLSQLSYGFGGLGSPYGLMQNAEVDRLRGQWMRDLETTNRPTAPAPSLFERATGAIGRGGAAVAAGAGAAVAAAGGPVGAILTVAAAVEIGHIIGEAVTTYLNRNVVHEPQSDFTGFDKMAELVHNLTRQGDIAGAYTTAAGNLKAAQQELEGANKRWAELAGGNPADLQAARTQLRQQLQARGVSNPDIEYVLSTGRLSRDFAPKSFLERMGAAQAGAEGESLAQRIPGTEGMSENQITKLLDLSTRLSETQAEVAKAQANMDAREREFTTARTLAGNTGPTAQDIARLPTREEAERLVIPYDLARSRYQSAEALSASNRQAIRQARGRPEDQFNAGIATTFDELDSSLRQYLDERVRNIQQKVPQLAQIDVATLLGVGGSRPGATDVAALNRRLAEGYGTPAAAAQHLPEILDQLRKALEANTQLVLKAPENSPQVRQSELQRILVPEIQGLFSGATMNIRTPSINIINEGNKAAGSYGAAGEYGQGQGGATVSAVATSGLLRSISTGVTRLDQLNGVFGQRLDAWLASRPEEARRRLHIGPRGAYATSGHAEDSDHYRGTAVDIQGLTPEDVASLAQFGLAQNVPGDNPHIEPAEIPSAARASRAARIAASKAFVEANPGFYGDDTASAPGVVGTLYGRAAARQQGYEFQRATQERQDELKAAQINREAAIQKATADLDQAKAVKGNADAIAKAQTNLDRITADWDIRIKKIESTFPEKSPEVQAAMASGYEAFRTSTLARVDAESRVRQRDVRVQMEQERRQIELGTATGREGFAQTSAALAVRQGNISGAGEAFQLADQLKTELDYKKQIDAVTKSITEYESRHDQSPAVKEYLNTLRQQKTALEELAKLEEDRLKSPEALAKAQHEATVAISQDFDRLHQYSGDFFTGLEGGMKKFLSDQTTMYDEGKKAFQTFADGIATAFSDVFTNGQRGPKKALDDISKMLNDISRQLLKTFVDQALVKPLIGGLFGSDANGGNAAGGAQPSTGGSGIVGRGGGGGGIFGGIASLAAGQATKGLFSGFTDWLFGGSSGGVNLTSNGTFFGDLAGAQSAGFVVPSAYGNIYSRGRLVPFAGGGIVTAPTLFPMAGGAGLMGEAGPEGILPLRRGPGGALGVTNYGGSGHTITVNSPINVQVDSARGGQGQRSDPRQAQAFAEQLHTAARTAVIDEIRNQQRPGGMLYAQANNAF